MRVGFDARHAGLGLGIGVFVTRLAESLAAGGEAEVVWFGERLPYPLLDTALGYAAARRSGVDVFHFTGNTGWGRRRTIPFVLTIHDLIFLDSGARRKSLRQVIGHAYERANVRRASVAADAVAVPSEVTAAEVRAALPEAGEPVVIPNGVEVSDSMPTGSPEDPYIVAFGGRDPRKRVDLVLDGLLASHPIRYRLKVLAGAGLPPGFEHRVSQEVAAGRVELLGYLPREEMWRVVRGASALVYPSTAEGFGLPVLEAMSVGVPVVTGLTPATTELGGDAVLAIDPVEPVASIAAALRRVGTESGLARSLAERGRRRAAEFSWSRTAESYLTLYRAVCGS